MFPNDGGNGGEQPTEREKGCMKILLVIALLQFKVMGWGCSESANITHAEHERGPKVSKWN